MMGALESRRGRLYFLYSRQLTNTRPATRIPVTDWGLWQGAMASLAQKINDWFAQVQKRNERRDEVVLHHRTVIPARRNQARSPL